MPFQRLLAPHKLLDADAFRMEKRIRPSRHDYQVTHMEQTASLDTLSVHNLQENLQRRFADSEHYIRENPTKASLIAVGIGFLLAQLPLRWMFIALIKLLFLVIKPVTFVYAISKIIDDIRASRAE